MARGAQRKPLQQHRRGAGGWKHLPARRGCHGLGLHDQFKSLLEIRLDFRLDEIR